MVKLGFIVEGDAEKIILDSEPAKQLFSKNNISIVGIFAAEGEGNFKVESERIKRFVQVLNDRKADQIIIWTDLENDPCITFTLESIHKFDERKQINLISVKALESWFLADSKTLSKIFGQEAYYDNPEELVTDPFMEIKNLFMKYTGRGISKSKNRLAHKMIRNGFSIQNAARHPKCRSARYFIDKL